MARRMQATFAARGFDIYRRSTRRAGSQAETNRVMPREKAGLRGRGLCGAEGGDLCQGPEARNFVERRAPWADSKTATPELTNRSGTGKRSW